MYTKEEVLKRAHATGSKTATVHGAVKALRGVYVRLIPFERKPWDQPRRITSRKSWYATQSRARFVARMERLAQVQLGALGLLDRAQTQALIAATDEDFARREVARMRRMGPARRAAHLTYLLSAPAEADRLLHEIYDPLAMSLAESYSRHIGPISQSSRSVIEYGQGSEQKDWDAYSESYRFPAVWRNPGVTVVLDAIRGPLATIHTTRGKAITLPLLRGVDYGSPALLDGDLYAIEHHGIIERFSGRNEKTGIAMRVPAMAGLGESYEHGRDIAECRVEYEHKLRSRRDRAISLLHDTDYRARRKARLVARLCRKLVCTIDDARSVGYCRAGIDAFRRRHGLGTEATVADLRRCGDGQVSRVIEAAAVRCLRSRKENHA
jgi:hypothetical protein